MINLQLLKTDSERIKENIKNRFMSVDLDEIIELSKDRNKLLASVEGLRQERNETAQKMKSAKSNDERVPLIERGKALKSEIAEIEQELKVVEARYKEETSKIPNFAHPDAPIGKEDKDNLEIERVGEIPNFDFEAKDHVFIGENLDIIDFETASKVTGSKFYYLKNEGVFLELALIRFALDKLQAKGFTPVITPDIAKASILEGIGFNPRGEESNIYSLEDTETCLVGTAEITLGGFLSNNTFSDSDLPIMLAGFSHCFRREAGAAGQYSKGLYRVHQFSKVEMFLCCKPEDSDEMHKKLLEIEKEIFSDLEIPFRVVDTCTGDLGAPAYRKFDLEAWMPGRGESGDWGEVTSTSNCTDFQSRRLNIKYKNNNGKKEFVHMLNGTAIAISRAIVAILENFQQEDGSILIPKNLVKYTGFDKITKK